MLARVNKSRVIEVLETLALTKDVGIAHFCVDETSPSSKNHYRVQA